MEQAKEDPNRVLDIIKHAMDTDEINEYMTMNMLTVALVSLLNKYLPYLCQKNYIILQ